MAELLHITTPVSPKQLDYAPKNNQQAQSDQVFNLGDTSRVQKTTERTEEYTNQDTKDGGGLSIQVSGSKNPAAAIGVLRSIVGSGAFSAISSDGSADILNKVTEFANEVMLKPSNLSSDMIAQEKESTVYSDPIWSEMKDILMHGSDEIGEAVLQFTKAVSDASARDDIVNSVAASLRFLAGEAAQTRELVDALNRTADMLTKENFAEMKGTIFSMLETLHESLLMNDGTKNLISLIVYNMSRFNGSTTAVGESFNAILDMTGSQEQADALRAMFMSYIENADLPTDIKLEALNIMVQGSAPATSSLSLLAEKAGEAMNSYPISAEELASAARNIAGDGGTGALRDLFGLVLPGNMYGALNNIIKSYDSTGNIASLIDRLSIMINSVDDMGKKNILADKTNEILSNLPFLEKDVSFASDSILNQQSMTLLSQKLGENLNNALNSVSAEKLSQMLSGADTSQGAASVRHVFELLLPQNSTGELNLLLRSFNSTGNLNKLIDSLSLSLNSVDNPEKKIILAQSLNEILGNLTKAEGINYNPPTSMSNLMDFLAKNLNDPSLKSLSAMSRSDIMQGLLSAPGALTPLLHYLVPINDDGVKAFGELWADPDAENSNGAEEANHLFLCFEIENMGYFELDVLTSGKKLNISLLCPAGTESVFRPLKESIGKIASINGYNAENTNIGTVVKRRDLTQVFPKIQERRSGLNVKI